MNYKKVIAYNNQGVPGSGLVYFELEERDQKPESKVAVVQAFPEKLYPGIDFHGLPSVSFWPCIEHIYRGENPIGDLSGMTDEELQDAIRQLQMVESEEWLLEQRRKYIDEELQNE